MSGIRRKILCSVACASAVLALPAPDRASADDAVRESVRGVVRAEATAVVTSELVARIAEMPFKEGEAFRAGDALVTFDCSRYQADLRAVEAEVKTQQITVETNRQLLSHRAAGSNDLALAEAKLAQANAQADSLRVRTGQCRIVAPYDGHVVERNADIFDMPQANAPLMKIAKDGALEVDLIVPSSWSVWLSLGLRFPFRVDETGTTHDVALLRLGAAVDPISRTLKVRGALISPPLQVKPGMSGSAMLAPPAGDGRR
jgi:RND family efflux transporter MFP subunit